MQATQGEGRAVPVMPLAGWGPSAKSPSGPVAAQLTSRAPAALAASPLGLFLYSIAIAPGEKQSL